MPKAGETDRWPPSTNGMPDLSNLEANLLNSVLNEFFRGAGPVEIEVKALWKNYIRLIDQILWEYNAARESLQYFIDQTEFSIGHLGYLFRAVAHMETLLNTMRRAIKFARRIRNVERCFKFKKLSVLKDDVGKRIIKIRNDIEHLEDAILNGEITEESATTMKVESDRIELLNNVILYADLANWITELHSLSIQLVDYHPIIIKDESHKNVE